MLKNLLILIFTMAAINFAPVNSYACKKHEKNEAVSSCCKNKKSSKTKCEHKAEKNKKCKSACNHSGCNCPVSQTVSILFPLEIITANTPEFTLKNNYFLTNQNTLSKGYYSIWLPPNIGRVIYV